MKKIVRLTEGDLVRIIKKVISENDPKKQKTEPAAISGGVVKLSKLKNNQDLVNRIATMTPYQAEDVFALLADNKIVPQPNSKFDITKNNEDRNLMADFRHVLEAINTYFLKYVTDNEIGKFCKTRLRTSNVFCSVQGLNSVFSAPSELTASTVRYLTQVYNGTYCPILVMIQHKFGYPDGNMNVEANFDVLVMNHIKNIVAAAGYTC